MESAQQLIARIDWPNAMAGFALGLLPIILPAVIRYLRGLFSPARAKYTGRFLVYHRSGTSPAIVRKKRIHFSMGFSGQIAATMPVDSVTHLGFKGQLLSGTGGIIFGELSAQGHRENIYFVFYEPIASRLTVTTGILATTDMHGNPSAWRCVLAREDYPEDRIAVLLTEADPLKAIRPTFGGS